MVKYLTIKLNSFEMEHNSNDFPLPTELNQLKGLFPVLIWIQVLTDFRSLGAKPQNVIIRFLWRFEVIVRFLIAVRFQSSKKVFWIEAH